MKILNKPVLCLIFILFSWHLFSLERPFHFKYVSIEEGLSQSSVYSICQDKRGFLWFGTESGLNRYDGYKFTLFEHDNWNPNSIIDNNIYSIIEDSSGFLWIGTDYGVSRYDPLQHQFTNFAPNPEDAHAISNRHVNYILEDCQGTIWVATSDGLNRFDKTANHFIVYRTVPQTENSINHNDVRVLYEDSKGILWIGSYGGGLNQFRRESDDFISFSGPNGQFSVPLSDYHVLSICQDRFGLLWVGTLSGGLNVINGNKNENTIYNIHRQQPFHFVDNQINFIFEDSRGWIWIATQSFGVSIFDRKTNCFYHQSRTSNKNGSISSNYVCSVYEDRSGCVWVGTYGGGLNKFIYELQKFKHIDAGVNTPLHLSGSIVRPIYEDRSGLIWIGTDGAGLNQYDPKTGKINYFYHQPENANSLSSNRVFAIHEDADGIFWIGTMGKGINRFNSQTREFRHFLNQPDDLKSLSSNFIRMFMEDSQKRFWVATHDGGLNLFNKETGVCKRYLHNPDDPHSISNNTVFYIIEDRNKTIWIATFGGGLNRYVPEKDNFISYQHSTQDACPISDNYLLGLFEDSSGYIWIGTNGSGLNRYNPKTGKFKQFNNTHGLAGNVVYEIREDKEGCLWISTGSGLSRFNPEMLIFRNYDFHDGLQSNEFNLYSALKSRSGLFYFGGINGITIFNPQEIQDNKKIPPVVLTEFSIFGKPVQLGQILNDRVLLPSPVFNLKQIELKHNENVVSFEFAALHYVAPEKNHYAYKLEGLEKKWNYSKNRRFVTYSSIPPGDYVFRVKASNNNNIWNETGTAINIKIIPPFWRANWFIVLLFSALIGLIFIIYRYRVEKIHLREQELEQLVIERTIQLEQANRELKRLATIDSLTGIANHRWLVQFMNHEWRRSARINKPISLIAIDVDYFKLYNDTYGHQMGDECLKKIANVMKCIANRPGDLAARYGGEEFMVILSETDQKGAAIIAEKIRSGVEQLKIIHEKSITHPFVTISAGVATVIPDESQNYSALINLADRALYISKNNGRNQINHI